MFGDKVDPLEDTVRFMRITLLGASGCGKTALITSFVSSTCPIRAITTEQAQVYYRKIDMREDGDIKAKAALLEIEDTPGSEKGHDSFADPTDGDPMRMKRGSRVRVHADRKVVIQHFVAYKKKTGNQLPYERGMDAMLGNDYTVKTAVAGAIGLVAQEGGDVWEFPQESLSLRLGISLPIDPFLDSGEKPLKTLKKLKERKERTANLQRPLCGYDRLPNAPNSDTAMAKTRMGFLICFDVSDDDKASLQEAVKVHKMLTDRLNKRQNHKAKPIIWFVACKMDKTVHNRIVQENVRLARQYTEEEDIMLKYTSARKHQGTWDLFCEMAQLIENRVPLWRYVDEDGDDEDAEAGEANCSVQ